MTSLTRPRGRHPARVYWVRRMMVGLTALLLVFAIGRLLGGSGGSGGPSGDTAGTVAHHTAGAHPTRPASSPASTQPAGPVGNPTATTPRLPLAQPSGPCVVSDITVTPTITNAVAGGTVLLGMQLTGIKPACTFEVSHLTIAVKITKADNRIWTSQQCPLSIRTRDLVVRSAVPIPIVVRWSGRRSDDQCSLSTDWALPGTYTVTAAAIGSTPTQAQFVLLSPPRPTVTRTITPSATPTRTRSPGTPTATTTWGNGDNALPHKSPTAKATGAVD